MPRPADLKHKAAPKINRLILEKPDFEISVQLGFGLIKLINGTNILENIKELFSFDSISYSFAEALLYYKIVNEKPEISECELPLLENIKYYSDENEIKSPMKVYIPMSFIREIMDNTNIIINPTNNHFVKKSA